MRAWRLARTGRAAGLCRVAGWLRPVVRAAPVNCFVSFSLVFTSHRTVFFCTYVTYVQLVVCIGRTYVSRCSVDALFFSLEYAKGILRSRVSESYTDATRTWHARARVGCLTIVSSLSLGPRSLAEEVLLRQRAIGVTGPDFSGKSWTDFLILFCGIQELMVFLVRTARACQSNDVLAMAYAHSTYSINQHAPINYLLHSIQYFHDRQHLSDSLIQCASTHAYMAHNQNFLLLK